MNFLFKCQSFTFFVLVFIAIATSAFAKVDAPLKPLIAPGTISATAATLVWSKPDNYAEIKKYHIFINGKNIGIAEKCNFMLKNLSPATNYTLAIKAANGKGELSALSVAVKFRTLAKGNTIDVTSMGAKGDGITLNTKIIQQAIDDCKPGGTVLIPKGTFLSGALFLKSNMTLQIEKGATLKGSTKADDYLPMINNRFEGWEMKTYASLLNAGVMNNKGGFVVENLAIKGEGTISGGGDVLGKEMIAKAGMRSRGRLILLMNAKNVEIQGLEVKNSPCWTIHYIYSKGISLHDLNISSNVRNGDGIDPDSSDDSYIFNCTINTKDDCIAIKSGKNPEGYTIGKPTKNVNITDCNFIGGHGISIGSEMSGGVSDVVVRDCKAGPLLHGMQIKGTKDRGGYVRNVLVADCELQQITIFSAVNYNNDGEAAPVPPIFENFVFQNIDLSAAPIKEPVIDINGFQDPKYKLKNVVFSNIILPENAKVVVKDADLVKFIDVTTKAKAKPKYTISNSTQISN